METENTLSPSVAMEIVQTLDDVRQWAYVDARAIMGHILVRLADLDADRNADRFSDNSSRINELQLLVDDLKNLEEVEAFKAREAFNIECAYSAAEQEDYRLSNPDRIDQ